MFYDHNLLSVFRNSSKRITHAHYIESVICVHMHCVYLFLKAFPACTVIYNPHVLPHQSLKQSILLLKELWKVWLRIFLHIEVVATWIWEFYLKEAKVDEGDRQIENAKKQKESGEKKQTKTKAKREKEKIKWEKYWKREQWKGKRYFWYHKCNNLEHGYRREESTELYMAGERLATSF